MNRIALRFLFVSALLGSFVQPGTALGGRLNLSRGTMSVGGTFSFQIEADLPKDRGDSVGFLFGASPRFGYFVLDGFELGAELLFAVPFGDPVLFSGVSAAGQITIVGFSVGGRYAFNPGGIVRPYLGFSIGPSFWIPEDDNASNITFLDLSIPFGMLIGINEHIALTVGISPIVSVGLSSVLKGAFIRVPMGVFGIEGFF